MRGNTSCSVKFGFAHAVEERGGKREPLPVIPIMMCFFPPFNELVEDKVYFKGCS